MAESSRLAAAAAGEPLSLARPRFAELFPLIFENAAEGILLTSTDGSIFAANPAACRILGRSQEEICRAGRAGILDTSDPALPAALEERERTGRARAELTALWPDGSRVPVEVSSAVLERNGPSSLTVMFLWDVSERSRAREALRSERELLDRVFSVLEDPVVVVDFRTRLLVRANRAAEAVFGWTCEEMVGRDTSFLHVDQEHFREYGRLLEEAYATRGWFEGEFPMRRKSGEVFPARHLARTVRHGELSLAVGMIRDLTSQRRAEAERARLESALLQAQKMESLSAFAGGVAHDFNNLLVAVLANAEAVAAAMPPDAPGRAALDDVAAAARRGAALVRQLLAYAGRARVVRQPLDLSRAVGDVLHILRASVPRKIALETDLAERAPLLGDRGQLGQVVINLVLNAAEAIGDREGHIAISTGVEKCPAGHPTLALVQPPLEAGPYSWLEVRDDGAGMPPEVTSRIFDPFFSTRSVGRGLGLSAVAGVVRAHGGAVQVESSPGRGSRFRLWLPAGGPVPAPERPAVAAGTVLVVDDEPMVRRLAGWILEDAGYRVLEAGDGVEALELFRSRGGEIDVVLLDFDMPRMDGADTFDAIRAISPGARVLLSTGYGDQPWMERFRGQGLAGTLEKPYAASELVAAVRAARASRA
jgi:PAS domain S-box-containing protein